MSTLLAQDCDSLSFEQIRSKLDEMNIRYSVRKDATREYLLQTLKHHLKRLEETAFLAKLTEEESILRETHSQPTPEYVPLSGDRNSYGGKENRFCLTSVTKNFNERSALKDYNHAFSGKEDGLTYQYDMSRIGYTPQGKQDSASYEENNLNGVSKDLAQEYEGVDSTKEDSKGSLKNLLGFTWASEPRKRSFMKESHVAEMIDQSRNCYSDSYLLRGGVKVDEKIFPRNINGELNLPYNENGSEKKGSYRKDSMGRQSCFGVIKEEEEAVEKKKSGNMKRMVVWALMIFVTFVIFVFYLRYLLPSYLYGQRTPVVFPRH